MRACEWVMIACIAGLCVVLGGLLGAYGGKSAVTVHAQCQHASGTRVSPVNSKTSNVTVLNAAIVSLHWHLQNAKLYCMCMHHLCIEQKERVCAVKQWSRAPHEAYTMLNPVLVGAAQNGVSAIVVDYVTPNMVNMRLTFEGSEAQCLRKSIDEMK
jgi:hypothetical protein